MSGVGQQEPVVTVVVDVANVMGARPDGWWRDRAGAALRLCQQVTALATGGIPAGAMPGGLPVPGEWVLVLEGRARDAAAGCPATTASDAGVARVRVALAPGSGDDAIVAEAASAAAASAAAASDAASPASAAGTCLVVTADRELRRRCEAAGAMVTGPGWLLGLL